MTKHKRSKKSVKLQKLSSNGDLIGLSAHPSHHQYIQSKLRRAILDPAFQFNLPELSPNFSYASRDERSEVFETIGDALLHSTVALELYKRDLQTTPHYLTVVRGAINSNCTFAHFMAKGGAFVGETHAKSGKTSKPVADAFETLIAAFYFDRGFEALCKWVGESLGPLFTVAQQAYDEYAKDHPTKRPKRILQDDDDDNTYSQKRRRINDRATASTSTIMDYRRAHSLSPGHDDIQILPTPVKQKRKQSITRNGISQPTNSSLDVEPRYGAQIIDLTNDTDDCTASHDRQSLPTHKSLHSSTSSATSQTFIEPASKQSRYNVRNSAREVLPTSFLSLSIAAQPSDSTSPNVLVDWNFTPKDPPLSLSASVSPSEENPRPKKRKYI